MSEPSELFWSVICDAGTPVQTCGFCGRTHFVSNGDYNEGELDQLREKEKRNPDLYREHSECDSISCGEFAGTTVVYHCPCGKAGKYEEFIWENRRMILEYLKKRIAQQSADAATDAAALERVKGARNA